MEILLWPWPVSTQNPSTPDLSITFSDIAVVATSLTIVLPHELSSRYLHEPSLPHFFMLLKHFFQTIFGVYTDRLRTLGG
jgi:hypothetical protein